MPFKCIGLIDAPHGLRRIWIIPVVRILDPSEAQERSSVTDHILAMPALSRSACIEYRGFDDRQRSFWKHLWLSGGALVMSTPFQNGMMISAARTTLQRNAQIVSNRLPLSLLLCGSPAASLRRSVVSYERPNDFEEVSGGRS